MSTRWLLLVAALLAACGSSRRAVYPSPATTQVVTPSPSPSPAASPGPPPPLYVPPRSTTCLPLDSSRAPLAAVLQELTPSVPAGFAYTIQPFTYVSDLLTWEQIYPEGSVNRQAILDHEQVHGARQLAVGHGWFDRYAADPAFRLAEEELGYAAQIKTLAQAGVAVDVDGFVVVLTEPYYGDMISAADARAWLLSQVAAAGGRATGAP